MKTKKKMSGWTLWIIVLSVLVALPWEIDATAWWLRTLRYSIVFMNCGGPVEVGSSEPNRSTDILNDDKPNPDPDVEDWKYAVGHDIQQMYMWVSRHPNDTEWWMHGEPTLGFPFKTEKAAIEAAQHWRRGMGNEQVRVVRVKVYMKSGEKLVTSEGWNKEQDEMAAREGRERGR